MTISMKRLSVSTAAALSLILAPSAALAAETSTPGTAAEPPTAAETNTSTDQVTIDLYNLTDIHGHIEKVTNSKTGAVTEAGLAATSCYINKAKEKNPDSQFLLLGDNIGASPFTSGSQNDNPTIEALNKMGVFASTIGNHEFDKGIQALKDRFEGKNGFSRIDFRYLGANVEGLKPYLDDYAIWTAPSGVKIAFIGAIEDDVATKLAPGTVDSLTFNKPAPVINKIAEQLKTEKKADIVVAMFDNDVERSYPLMGKYVDGIMGGDTHKPYYFTQVKANDGHVLSATASGSFTDNLSNLQFVYNKKEGKIVASKAIQIPAADVAACGEDEAVKKVVDAAAAKAKEKKAEVVSTGTGSFYRGIQKGGGENRGTESTIGGLIGDSMKNTFKDLDGNPIDIGIINAGGIRADLVSAGGKLTVGDVFAAQPFSNEVGYVKMTGAQFKTLLEQQWKQLGKILPAQC
ncbi:5'-nucleotidase C-terminal domain-containing protein [Arcanobacterium hippocoleae]